MGRWFHKENFRYKSEGEYKGNVEYKDFLFFFLRGGFSPLYSSSSSSFFFFGSHFKQCRAACVGDELQLPFFPFSLHSFTHERVGGE